MQNTAKDVIYEKVVQSTLNSIGISAATGPTRVVKKNKPLVFISYCSEDHVHALRIYKNLKRAGFNPWIDREKLVVGQNWWRAIERTITASDYCLFLFSSVSTTRRSFFNRELRFALEIQKNTAIEQTFILPLQLGDCKIPSIITEEIQIVKMYPFSRGLKQIRSVLKRSR